jgi:glycine cleavage system H protein
MQAEKPKTLHYKRSHFATQLPVDYLYTPSHAWLARQADGSWRVGLTRFATRMLGHLVDHGFEVEPGAAIEHGQILGWVEGFKAISDLYGVVRGEFLGRNPLLLEKPGLVDTDGYGRGWLYAARGEPDPKGMDVHAYRSLLDVTIDKILAKQQAEQARPGSSPSNS